MTHLSAIPTVLAMAALIWGCSAKPDSPQRSETPQDLTGHAIDWTPSCQPGGEWTLALHAGAGVITRGSLSSEQEAAYLESLGAALQTGADMLSGGAQALDAVEATVRKLENDPKFNAGKGAVFSAAGKNELDASIMDGRSRNAGAVASVKTIKNPVSLARAVMENSRHVMLISDGAEDFARENGIESIDPNYFYTDRRWKQLQDRLAKKAGSIRPETKYGTVGVVAKDGCGDLAAGTSTGGLTAKEWGRVGDTPIIGAGTYADNRYCAVSATGTGEYFIRASIAKSVCARREYLGEDLQTAMDAVIHGTLSDMGGDGGIVALDDEGNFAFSFNTEGMYRGGAAHDKAPRVLIYK